MKITKRQLRRIIKEEKARLMEYGGRPYDPTRPGDFERYRDNPTGDAPPGVSDDYLKGIVKGTATPGASVALGDLHKAIDQLIKALGNEEAYSELQGIVEDWDSETR